MSLYDETGRIHKHAFLVSRLAPHNCYNVWLDVNWGILLDAIRFVSDQCLWSVFHPYSRPEESFNRRWDSLVRHWLFNSCDGPATQFRRWNVSGRSDWVWHTRNQAHIRGFTPDMVCHRLREIQLPVFVQEANWPNAEDNHVLVVCRHFQWYSFSLWCVGLHRRLSMVLQSQVT